jgi:hypothetical protein
VFSLTETHPQLRCLGCRSRRGQQLFEAFEDDVLIVKMERHSRGRTISRDGVEQDRPLCLQKGLNVNVVRYQKCIVSNSILENEMEREKGLVRLGASPCELEEQLHPQGSRAHSQLVTFVWNRGSTRVMAEVTLRLGSRLRIGRQDRRRSGGR